MIRNSEHDSHPGTSAVHRWFGCPSGSRSTVACILTAAIAFGGPVVTVQGQTLPETAPAAEAPEFLVSEFVFQFEKEVPGLPTIDALLDEAGVNLARTGDGYIAASEGLGDAATLSSLNQALRNSGPVRFSRRALEEINRSMVRALNARGYIGVLIATSPDDIGIDVADPGAELASPRNVWTDLRPGSAGPLHITVFTARVVQVRTVASGDRVPGDQGVNHPLHERIRRNSPIQPESEGSEPGEDVLRRDRLDEYTFRLNRYPGRRVDVAVSTADEPGDVVLDYLVRENKPWFIFSQLSNSGTRETEEIRQRFGFIHNQLTGNDDQLVIDYITSGFAETHGLVGSYEFPIGERIRVRTFGTYSKFDASQVGLSGENFVGESWSTGGDIAWNFFQKRDLFIDFVAGLRWESLSVDNQAVDVQGRDSFFLPSLGLRLERFTDEAGTSAFVRTEWNLPGIAATGDPQLEALGRTDPDDDFTILQYGFEQSFFLEPLIDARRFREGKSTLAHELALRFRGQNSFGARLAPTFQDVIGGMNTVRGYPESLVAGDDVYVGTVEYRLHIPRLLEPYDERDENPPLVFGNPFRFRPQTRYARPDFDVIAKAFLDVGRAENADRQSFESDETLIGAGYGIELLVGRNLNLRLDWGVALRDTEEPSRVTSGSSRVHFVVTLLF